MKAITFSGAKAFPNEQIRSQFAITNGDIFNTEKIRAGIDSLRRLYESQGYINMTPVPNTDADDASATVSLAIDIDEGKQFRFGGLLLNGEELQVGTGAKLIAAWKPYEGKIYDPKLWDTYWEQIKPFLPASIKQEKASGMKQDPESAVVFPMIIFAEAD